MSSIFDDDYIKKQLAIQDNNNFSLTLGQKKFTEASLVCLINLGIDLLEKREKINSTTAKIMRHSVTLIDNIVKLWLGWF